VSGKATGASHKQVSSFNIQELKGLGAMKASLASSYVITYTCKIFSNIVPLYEVCFQTSLVL
jgi:hypothetical protein